jgi:putative hemolysin
MGILLSIAVVAGLILVEGLFVGAEIALISLREGQVRAMEGAGGSRRRAARLVRDPNRFLASTQIGVTLTALLSSAFGAVTLSARAARWLESLGVASGLAHVLGFLGVTMVISYVTLVVGELAPKRLALQRAERTAALVAPALDRIARMSRPLIWVLSVSTNGLVRLLGGDPSARGGAITNEELRGLVAAQASLSADERRLIDDVFTSRTRPLREVLTPRTEVMFLDRDTTVAAAVEETADMPHSRYPVTGDSADDVVGFVHVRDLVIRDREPMTVGSLARPVKRVPDSLPVLRALSEMRREGHHLAIVVDEYGGTAGIVTLEDLIEEVVGDIRDEYDDEEDGARPVGGGDFEVAGLLNLDEFAEATGVCLPDGPYETVGGYVMRMLGHLPRVGESVAAADATLTVAALDGRRIGHLRVTRPPTPPRDHRPPAHSRTPANPETVSAG